MNPTDLPIRLVNYMSMHPCFVNFCNKNISAHDLLTSQLIFQTKSSLTMMTKTIMMEYFLAMVLFCVLCVSSGAYFGQNKSEDIMDSMMKRYQAWLEFKARYLGYRSRGQWQAEDQNNCTFDDSSLPSSIDWRKFGAVTPIKNQGTCGSCWAFSTVAAVEGINKIKTGKLVSLSEQELVDCDYKGENEGCSGGYMEKAFEFIKNNDGITTEKNYPYEGVRGRCKSEKAKEKTVAISGYVSVPPKNEKALQVAVAKQPVAVAVDAGGYEFQLYSSGILSGYCGKDLNHGVAVVGYGVEGGEKYWLVKNSWGTNWGEEGYVKIKRDSSDKNGECGIALEASYPTKGRRMFDGKC